jgi:UDP-N-acetylmuramoylalanine--D-glutamate ligase
VTISPSLKSNPSDAPGEFEGRRVVVMGLGRFGGGVGVTRWLHQHGARVLVTDLAGAKALETSKAKLADLDIQFRLGGHDAGDLDRADLLVVNPAVDKRKSSLFQEAVRRGIPWTTEINLFLDRCPARIVGVTGTAGKSTTSAMIHAVLSRARLGGSVYLGGNIGRSLLAELPSMSAHDIVVLELSSFQLDDITRIERRPDIAVVVNIGTNHVDRHGSLAAYRNAKLNIVRGAKSDIPVVVGFNDDALLAAIGELTSRVVRADESVEVWNLRVPGAHNLLNARCAAAACRLVGASEERISRGLQAFPGLEHRLQHVGSVDGVDYFNDSKATSIDATITALRSFDRQVIALVGGRSRDVRLDDLADALKRHSSLAVCFGEMSGPIFDAVRSTSPAVKVSSVADAVAEAKRNAVAGDIVLFSPGFQSYDEFANYEYRGHAFVSLVLAM